MLGIEPHPRGDRGGELADGVRVAARVGVAGVDRVREAARGVQARGPIRPVGEPAEVRELGDLGSVDLDAVLPSLLRRVEGVVGELEQLLAIERVLRVDRDPDRDAGGGADLVGRGDDALDHRLGDPPAVVLADAGEHERELVASEPEGLAAPAQARADLDEDAVAGSVAVDVVHALEVVDVDQTERDGSAERLRAIELLLETLVERARIAEPGQGIRSGEPHRLERAVNRPLVERDRDERTDERGRERRRPVPRLDEENGDRHHDRERQRGHPQVARDDRSEVEPRGARHDGG